LLLGTFFRVVVTGDIGLLSTIFAHVLVALGFSSLDSDTLTGSLFHSCLTGSHSLLFFFGRFFANRDLPAHQDGSSLTVHHIHHVLEQVVRL
jgi:hypothetical protein